MIACWGRPPALRLEDCDVQPLTMQDFATRGVSTMVSLQSIKLMERIGIISELNTKKGVPSEEEVERTVTSLCNWQQNLPDELRLYDYDGTRRPFYRPTSEMFIHYFTAIVLVQMLSKDSHMQWRTSAPSILAASCVARLYDEILCREQHVHLLNIHGFLCLATAVVLNFYRPSSPEKEVLRKKDMGVICSVLDGMRAKYGGARLILKKIQKLQHDVESGRERAAPAPQNCDVSSAPWVARRVQDRLGELFPFPPSFCKNMDILELGENRGSLMPANYLAAVDEALFGQSSDAMFSLMDVLDMNFGTFDAMGSYM